MGGSSLQPHTEQLVLSFIHFETKICTHLNIWKICIQTPLVRNLSAKSRPHHRHRSSIEDAKRGWLFKTRTHPSALHEPMRKKLHCVKVGVHVSENSAKDDSPNVARFYRLHANVMRQAQSSGVRNEDYFAKALSDYKAEFEVPFTLRHCWGILRHSQKWWDQEVPKFLTNPNAAKRSKASGSRSFQHGV
nr:hypothetical protein [Tanacetum cinerariifolium]